MTGTVKISIIVPVYNMAQLMRRALDSLAEQRYRDFEVILVDDGSTDESPRICDEYADKYENFRVIHKPNGGVSSARNAGLATARGEWVTFCDPDDFTYPCWLDNYDLDTSKDYQLLCQGFEATKPLFGRNHNQSVIAFDFDGSALGLLNLLCENQCIGFPWHKMYRLSVIHENALKFDTSVRLKEDELFFIEYIRYSNKARATKEVGYKYMVPDWNRKYELSGNENVYFHERILGLLEGIKDSPSISEYYRYIRQELTTACLHEVRDNLDLKSLKKIRKYHLTDHNFSNLNYLCRTLLIYDSTMILSCLAIWCHMQLRKALGI